jgi:hypothetical protein
MALSAPADGAIGFSAWDWQEFKSPLSLLLSLECRQLFDELGIVK